MSSYFVVPELGTDFTQDFEDLVIAYLFTKWSITDPAKGTFPQPDNTLEPNTIGFKAGFPDYFRPYEVCCVQTRTELVEQFSKSKYVFTTTLDIMLRMKRLERDAVAPDPQLENMENEVERIVQHYQYTDILGVKELSFSFPDSKARIGAATDSYAKTDWRSIIRVKLFYEKQDISPLS